LNFFVVLERNEIHVTLQIGNVTGFDLNKTILSFGSLSNGSSISRNLILKNNYPFPVKTELGCRGNICNFLVFERGFFVEEEKTRVIPVSTIRISNESYGNYSGNIIVVLKRRLL
jgi:hypothetical protein